MRRHRMTARALVAFLTLWVGSGTAAAATVPATIDFPVVGAVSYQDDFGDPRSGGRRHQGNDIMARRKAPVVAVEAGWVYRPTWSSGDCTLILEGASGTTYRYLHLNNDLTAANDNRGGCRNGVSFAFDLPAQKGVKKHVASGQLIGYVGDSGNANGVSAHLHFELHPGGGGAVSPYPWLLRGRRLLFAVPGSVASVRLALYGRFRWAADMLALDVVAVRVLGRWGGAVRPKRVRLLYTADLPVQRLVGSEVAAAGLSSAAVGERVTVWTGAVAQPVRSAQLGRAGVMVATKLVLRGF